MGENFINDKKGAIRKARERLKAKISTELLPQFKEMATILVTPRDGFCFAETQSFELHLDDKNISVYFGRELIGDAEISDPSLIEEIKKLGGRALGKIKRIRTHSKRADITVLLSKR